MYRTDNQQDNLKDNPKKEKNRQAIKYGVKTYREDEAIANRDNSKEKTTARQDYSKTKEKTTARQVTTLRQKRRQLHDK